MCGLCSRLVVGVAPTEIQSSSSAARIIGWKFEYLPKFCQQESCQLCDCLLLRSSLLCERCMFALPREKSYEFSRLELATDLSPPNEACLPLETAEMSVQQTRMYTVRG